MKNADGNGRGAPDAEEDEFFTVDEVRRRWKHKSTKTVYRAIRSKKLIAHKFGAQWRVSRADLRAYERLRRMD